MSIEISLIYLILKIVLAGTASFFAIRYLSRHRDLAWIFMIGGVLVLYLNLVFELLFKLKLFIPDFFFINGTSYFDLFSFISSVLPFVFFTIGFIIAQSRH